MPLSASAKDSPATTKVPVLLVGTRRCYAEQRAFFADQVARAGVSATLLQHLPQLLPGLAGAALHPIIHLAIGLRTGSDGMVAEGLAYLNHSHLAAAATPLTTAAGDGKAPMVAASVVAKQHVETALSRPPAPAVAGSGRFQRAMSGLLGNAATVGALQVAASGLGFTAETMLGKAVRLYLGDGRNDYFLLHVVTASWALGVVLDAVPDLPAQTRREAVEGLAVAAVATAWIQQTDLQTVGAQQTVTTPAAALVAVRAQVAKLCAEPEPRNEHVYKLVAGGNHLPWQPRICSRTLMGYPQTVFSRDGSLLPSSYADTRYIDAVIVSKAIAVEQLEQIDSADGSTLSTTAVDLRDAVLLAVSSDFSGRGIGEKPTVKVDLGGAPASMHQLVA